MKVLVPVKRVVDYNVKVRVKSDGTGVDIANVKMSMNPFDEIAVEEAVRLKEAGKATEVVAVSCGVTQCQETLRTAMAIGADRGILVETDCRTAAAGRRQAAEGAGRQGAAATDHPRQAGHRRRLQPDRPDAGCVAGLAAGDVCLESRDRRRQGHRHARSRRRPGNAVADSCRPSITTDLRLNEPRYVTLPNIMKAKKKPLETFKPADLGVDVDAAPEDPESRRAAQALRRHHGAGRGDAGRQAQERSESHLNIQDRGNTSWPHWSLLNTTTLSLKGSTLQHRYRCRADAAATSMCWSPAHNCGAAAEAAAKIAGVTKVLVADAAQFADGLAENVAAQVLALCATAIRTSWRRPPPTARTSLPRVAAKLDVAQISEITKVDARRHLRAPDLRRQRDRHRAIGRCGQGHHRAHHRLRRRRRSGGSRRRRNHRAPSPTPASRHSCRASWPSRTVPN